MDCGEVHRMSRWTRVVMLGRIRVVRGILKAHGGAIKVTVNWYQMNKFHGKSVYATRVPQVKHHSNLFDLQKRYINGFDPTDHTVMLVT